MPSDLQNDQCGKCSECDECEECGKGGDGAEWPTRLSLDTRNESPDPHLSPACLPCSSSVRGIFSFRSRIFCQVLLARAKMFSNARAVLSDNSRNCMNPRKAYRAINETHPSLLLSFVRSLLISKKYSVYKIPHVKLFVCLYMIVFLRLKITL